MQAEDPPKKLNQKEKTKWSISWVGLPKIEVSTKPIISQSLSANFNNIIMCMEQIFQDINKQMLETTYTLKLGQLLKIALDLKKYMW
jgi:Glu-tRNA(Gln) amidotransferase subunit E-like FAD-binding protein